MQGYPVKKVDTRLYIKGLSGPLVFRALYGIIATFLLFSALYILAGVFPAVLIGVPAFFGYLYRLNTNMVRKDGARNRPQGNYLNSLAANDESIKFFTDEDQKSRKYPSSNGI